MLGYCSEVSGSMSRHLPTGQVEYDGQKMSAVCKYCAKAIAGNWTPEGFSGWITELGASCS